MKKLLVVLLSFFLLMGCKKNDEPVVEQKSDKLKYLIKRYNLKVIPCANINESERTRFASIEDFENALKSIDGYHAYGVITNVDEDVFYNMLNPQQSVSGVFNSIFRGRWYDYTRNNFPVFGNSKITIPFRASTLRINGSFNFGEFHISTSSCEDGENINKRSGAKYTISRKDQ